jgi:hypothetical protein
VRSRPLVPVGFDRRRYLGGQLQARSSRGPLTARRPGWVPNCRERERERLGPSASPVMRSLQLCVDADGVVDQLGHPVRAVRPVDVPNLSSPYSSRRQATRCASRHFSPCFNFKSESACMRHTTGAPIHVRYLSRARLEHVQGGPVRLSHLSLSAEILSRTEPCGAVCIRFRTPVCVQRDRLHIKGIRRFSTTSACTACVSASSAACACLGSGSHASGDKLMLARRPPRPPPRPRLAERTGRAHGRGPLEGAVTGAGLGWPRAAGRAKLLRGGAKLSRFEHGGARFALQRFKQRHAAVI